MENFSLFILRLLKNQTARGGAVFLFGGVAVHLFYYLYRLAMGRLLSPADFGEVAAFLSLLLIVAVPAAPLQTIAAKIAARTRARGSLAGLYNFGLSTTWLATLLVLLAGGGVLLFSSSSTIVLLLFSVLFFMIAGVPRGILLGLERFSSLSFLVSLEGLARLIFGVLLVLWGFGVLGALGGVLASLALAYVLSLFFLRDVIAAKSAERFSFDGSFLRHTGSLFFAFLALNILLNVDVLLVQRYFGAEETGIFSAFATLGRTVFLFGMLISGVLFPVIVRRKEEGRETYKPLWIGAAATVGLSAAATLALWLFPRFFLWLLLGEQYLEGAPYLGYYGAIMGMMGAIFLVSYFFMAQGRFAFVYVLLAASVLEVFLIFQFHETFGQILLVFFTVLLATLGGFAVLLRRLK